MKNFRNIIITLFGVIFLYSCGYKIKNSSLDNNFNITNISMAGENRINYSIKNKLLLLNNSQSSNLLSLNINTKKNRTIKNKNENNEITDYQLTLNSNITINFVNKTSVKNLRVTETGSYKVSKYRLDTLNNEKKIIEIMSDNITKKISNQIADTLNDN